MKKWLLVVGLVLFGALAFAACGDGNDANTELADDGNLPQVSDDALDGPGDVDRDDLVTDGGPVSAPVCAPGFPDCEDTVVNTNDGEVEEDPPPSLRPAVEGQYTITIRFNETVDQDQLDEVGARIRDFDPDADYVIQESFPPTGVANFVAETEDVCLALVQGLEAETFVTSVACGPQLEPGDNIDPNEPVVNDLG
ncbi:MAG: hypothetical protein IIC91_15085 [Chloroflexi bacterium]|nr:hypothetical protein [Chloroflexota bacterium]